MATQYESDQAYYDERLARLRLMIEESEKFSAETRKLVAESRTIPLSTVFQGFIAIAALLGAGAAIAKLFFP
jgi:hypothetical protein